MSLLNAIVIGTEESFRQSVGRVLNEKDGLAIGYVSDVHAASAQLHRAEDLVFIVNISCEQEAVECVYFLHKAAARGRPCPTFVVLNQRYEGLLFILSEMGATECLCRPLNQSRLSFVVDMLLARARAQSVSGRGTRAHGDPGSHDDLIYESPAMRPLMADVGRVARLSTTILLAGETGTGKTHLAREIHRQSPRRDRPFVHVNCAALSPSLIESELFGHVRGAFTGADRPHRGKFAQAHDGTLLLDDVDSMPIDVQAKFLRAVEERVFEPLGAESPEVSHARLIVATNKCLETEAAEGRFRSDLLHRLNVISFHLPPLRERPADVEALAHLFREHFARQHKLACREIEPEAVHLLGAYSWPGNVRELRNVMERAVVLCGGAAVYACHLPESLRQGAQHEHVSPWRQQGPRNILAQARQKAELDELLVTLRRHKNNRSSAAADLGISRVALYKKLRKHGLQ
jgi:DNA-binding NtrC family response regulator